MQQQVHIWPSCSHEQVLQAEMFHYKTDSPIASLSQSGLPAHFKDHTLCLQLLLISN